MNDAVRFLENLRQIDQRKFSLPDGNGGNLRFHPSLRGCAARTLSLYLLRYPECALAQLLVSMHAGGGALATLKILGDYDPIALTDQDPEREEVVDQKMRELLIVLVG